MQNTKLDVVWCHPEGGQMLAKGEEGDGGDEEGKEDGREAKSISLYISPPPDRPPLRRLYW